MDSEIFKCSVCGSVLKNVDTKARVGYCEWCEEPRSIPRKEVNNLPQVVKFVENAVRAFIDKNYSLANKIAADVLEASYDNLPALYIQAYYKAYAPELAEKTGEGLDDFFKKHLQNVQPEPEEIESLKELIAADAVRLATYEEDLMARIVDVAADSEVGAFMEELSPKMILSRTNVNWFTPRMIEAYAKAASKTNTTKTWFALYKQVGENPASPEKNLSIRTSAGLQNFWNKYIEGVDKIYNSIADPEQKTKFTTAFAARKEKYKQLK